MKTNKLSILLPIDSDNFIIEGFISQQDSALFIAKQNEYLIHDEEIVPTNQAYVNYQNYFFKKVLSY